MLGDLHSKWLDSRSIDLEIATRMGLYSALRDQDGLIRADRTGEILVFPYMKGDEEVGAKYRGPKKVFWQKPGGRKQFWNVDILDDPLLKDGSEALLIVEGEMDALAVMSAGYPFVVSVPDGAPPARDSEGNLIAVPEGTADIDPNTDTKYGFLLSDWDRLSQVKRIIIGTDADEPGQRLAAELVRRIDRIRCSFVTMAAGIKDWNELLQKHGREEVLETIQRAKPYPVDGLYRLEDLPPEAPFRTFSTGWEGIDRIVKPYLGAFMVVGGFPGHGKSTWTMQLAANMAAMHSWTVAIASFEMQVVPYVSNALMSAYMQESVKTVPAQKLEKARAFVQRRFVFVSPNRADVDTEHDIDWLLDKCTAAVIREGVNMVLIDPFNEIEHRRRPEESQTEYIGRAIRKLKSFAMQYNVLVVVVVHPTKASSQMDSSELGLYNLADSSHWANKADIGVIVGRIGDPAVDTLTGIYVKKIRYQPDAGQIGQATVDFDREARIFV